MIARIALAAAVAAALTSPAAAQPAAADAFAGCYTVAAGLPDGWAVSFCLTADYRGAFTATGPAGACVRTMSWEIGPGREPTPFAWPADIIHLNVNWFSVGCPQHAAVLTDDIYCDFAGGGMVCTFDEEKGPRPQTVPARQVTVVRIEDGAR